MRSHISTVAAGTISDETKQRYAEGRATIGDALAPMFGIVAGVLGYANEEAAPPDTDAFPPLGEPGAEDGFEPKKRWDGKKVKNPNGRGYGYPDKNGNVWVPTRGSPSSGNSHGGEHWDVQTPGGGYTNVFPSGGGRGG